MYIKRSEDGFSLIEVSMILIIAGLLLGGVFAVKNIMAQENFRTQYYSSVITIGSALEEYAEKNGHYPNPAPINVPTTHPFYGKPITNAMLGSWSDCNNDTRDAVNGVFCRRGMRDLDLDSGGGAGNDITETILIGTVPFKVLGFNEDKGVDIYKQPFKYAVGRAMTDPATFSNDRGVIRLRNQNNDDMLGTDDDIHYLIMSHGENHSSSQSTDGSTANTECNTFSGSSLSLERQNCQNTSTFRIITQGTEDDQVDENQKIRQAILDTAGRYFDDAIHYQNNFTKDRWTEKGANDSIMTAGGDSDSTILLIGRDKFNHWWIDNSSERSQLLIQGEARTQDLLSKRLCDEHQNLCIKLEDVAAPKGIELTTDVGGIQKNIQCGDNYGLATVQYTGRASGGAKRGEESEAMGNCTFKNKIHPTRHTELGGSGIICVNGSEGINPDGTLNCI